MQERDLTRLSSAEFNAVRSYAVARMYNGADVQCVVYADNTPKETAVATKVEDKVD